ncbi:MAG: hypothetical protein IIC92_08515 [Chloroflexi bacterium]|nr:hypothetical protein [Chloroflexota bacterium]
MTGSLDRRPKRLPKTHEGQSALPRASVSGVEIEYETCDDPSDRALPLIHGVGVQLVGRNRNIADLLTRVASQRRLRSLRLLSRDRRDRPGSGFLHQSYETWQKPWLQ